jgi:hypothetical protein
VEKQQGFIGHLVGFDGIFMAFIGALARKSVQKRTQATIPSSTNPDQQAHALSPLRRLRNGMSIGLVDIC